MGGTQGVIDAVSCLVNELRVAMQLIGCSNIADLRDNCHRVIAKPEPPQ